MRCIPPRLENAINGALSFLNARRQHGTAASSARNKLSRCLIALAFFQFTMGSISSAARPPLVPSPRAAFSGLFFKKKIKPAARKSPVNGCLRLRESPKTTTRGGMALAVHPPFPR